MRYVAIDPRLFIRNRERLSKLLKPNSIVVLHSNDIMPMCADGVMPFVQNSNMIHLTGADQEETILVLYPDASDENQKEILFVRKTNEHIAIWEGDKYTKERATEITGVKNVQWTDSFDSTFHSLVQQAEHVYLSTNEHLRADVSVETRNDRFIKKCQSAYPLHKYERLSPLMHKLRTIKQPEEIKIMQKACDITESGFRRILKLIKPGVGEWEVEAALTHEFLTHGSKGHAYTPIIGGGRNACVLHYIENSMRLQDGDMVLMDVGAEYGNWNADMTRTVPVNGKFTDRQRAVYDAVLKVMRQANEILRPGLRPSEYQAQVLEFMQDALVGLGLIDEEDAKSQDASKPLVKKYFMHGTSHHIGLDVHDVSPFNEPFAVGQVLTIEPGIYIREENLGCRIENDVQIRENENFDLMANIPIEADEIEALMAGV
ncbi:MAG: aminopeptidase P N-terminal domain-containing protein [Rubritalea sp.]|uniref:aminopeptidase P N-terminal domain-containing protein n=1 Tax=Rubritalea sp. TaxID=2109375 RepID=UPI0032422B7A